MASHYRDADPGTSARAAARLEPARPQIDDFFRRLTANPAQIKIEDPKGTRLGNAAGRYPKLNLALNGIVRFSRPLYAVARQEFSEFRHRVDVVSAAAARGVSLLG